MLPPGVIAMSVDDTVGADVDPSLDGLLVLFNAGPEPAVQVIGELAGRGFALSGIQADGADAVVKGTTWDAASGTATVPVPGRTVAVLVDEQEAEPASSTTRGHADRVFATSRTSVAYTVRVAAADVAEPTGLVEVLDRGSVIATTMLTVGDGGRTELMLPRLPRGVHLLTARYGGSELVLPSRSRIPSPLLVW